MDRITIFTDGACSGNPGPGGWGAIVLLPDGHVRELGGGSPQTTNNKMELTATLEALKAIEKIDGPADLFTDSTYVIGGITSWVHGWKKNGWAKKDGDPVLNRDLWERLHALDMARRKRGAIEWRYVKGHSGNPGNERCDEISVAFSKGVAPDLYEGPLSGYGHDLHVRPEPPPTKGGRKERGGNRDDRSGKGTGRTVYLSLVGGALMRHDSWADCNARVKGVPNARYRKASSASEEAEILREWGIGP